jgi:hypothetical protein
MVFDSPSINSIEWVIPPQEGSGLLNVLVTTVCRPFDDNGKNELARRLEASNFANEALPQLYHNCHLR